MQEPSPFICIQYLYLSKNSFDYARQSGSWASDDSVKILLCQIKSRLLSSELAWNNATGSQTQNPCKRLTICTKKSQSMSKSALDFMVWSIPHQVRIVKWFTCSVGDLNVCIQKYTYINIFNFILETVISTPDYITFL